MFVGVVAMIAVVTSPTTAGIECGVVQLQLQGSGVVVAV